MATDSRGTVIWDWDGTLGYSTSTWSMCLLEVLDAFRPNHCLKLDEIKPHLAHGFPWHRPEAPHRDLCESGRWWAALESTLSGALRKLGEPTETADRLAKEVRERYISIDRWKLFDDTIEALEAFTADGWCQIILSNHVPELPDIVESLGVDRFFERVLTSASIGYDKPHPEAFRSAINASRNGHLPMWMVGDNVEADIQGAQAVGLSGVLVRRRSDLPVTQADGLVDVVRIVTSAER